MNVEAPLFGLSQRLPPSNLEAEQALLGALHIALTGDYVWSAVKPEPGFRPLRDVHAAFLPLAA